MKPFQIEGDNLMISAQVVETSVNVNSNSLSQDYTHPDMIIIYVPTNLQTKTNTHGIADAVQSN